MTSLLPPLGIQDFLAGSLGCLSGMLCELRYKLCAPITWPWAGKKHCQMRLGPLPLPSREFRPRLPAVPHCLRLRPSTPSQSNPSSFYLQEFSWILSHFLRLLFPLKMVTEKINVGLVRGEAEGRRSTGKEVTEAGGW